MEMITVYANKIDERFFPESGKQILTDLKNLATVKVEPWIEHYLERYFLSEKFEDEESLHRIYDKNKMPVQFHNYTEKPVYAVILSQVTYNYFALIIQYLNSLDKEINWDVEYVIKQYSKWVNNLKNFEKTKLVLECDNDYKWVQLLDVNTFRRESDVVQHCIARNDTPHLTEFFEGTHIFLSLRKNDNPCITLKYNKTSKIITDIVGKQNRKPDEKYFNYITEIMNYLGLRPQCDNVGIFKFIKNVNGNWTVIE